MKPAVDELARSDRVIAGLLWYGTWFACGLIGAGLLLAALQAFPIPRAMPVDGHEVVKAGVAVFILLPIARVALMLAIFLRRRDYPYTLVAALVLAIIAAGIIIEI